MRKNFIFIVVCLLAGCANSSRPDFRVAVQGGADANVPPLKIKADQQLPVEVKTPIKIETKNDMAMPVEIKTQDALPVEVKTPVEIKAQEGQTLPVEMKVDRTVVIAAVALAAIAIFTFLTAVFAYLAARNIRRAVEKK